VAERSDGGTSAGDLSSAVDRALALAKDLLEQRERAVRRLNDVERRSGPERAVLVARNQRGLAGPGLVVALIQRAIAERTHDPATCRLWAESAVVTAEQLLERAHLSLRARAWAEKGNAERIVQDFAAARVSFDRALELLESAEGGVLSFRGDVYSLLGSLEIAQASSEAALGCFREALASYKELGQAKDANKVLIKRASVLADQGAMPQALRDLILVIRSALNDGEVHRSETVISACHNILWNLAEVALATRNQSEKALSLQVAFEGLCRLAPLYQSSSIRGLPTHFRWLFGRLYLASDKLEEAEVLLDDVVAEFLDLNLPASAAMATLDLALALALRREFGELRAVAGAACVVLEAKGLHSDAWAAQRLLLDCDLTTARAIIVEGLQKAGGASMHRTPGTS